MEAVEQLDSYESIMAYAGYVLRDGSLEEVEHFFVYSADDVAHYFLGSGDPDEGPALEMAA